MTDEACNDGADLIPRLTGQHVVIVGGSSGVGLALAAQCARAGARLTLLARDIAKLRDAAGGLVGDVQVRSVDLRRSETISPAVEKLGAVDHLVITAGSFRPAVLSASHADDWREVFEERLIGPIGLIQALAPTLKRSIVLFSGTIARRPSAGFVALAAAAAGVEAATRALALELAPIRVNAVAPGMLDTPLLDAVLGAQKTALINATAQRLPAKCVGRAADAASAGFFLMNNPYMSGATLQIDGGSVLV
jgi:NAD(P)-dependent dehydrogenase (short-subunit alcohol dehydrogenase family)